jgi:hypothetical protein
MDESEAVSETRHGGRPRVLRPEDESFFRNQFPDVRTTWGRQNLHYRIAAISVLKRADEPERIAWLWDEAAIMAGTGRSQRTILQELGRIDDDDDLIAMARRIYELTPKTREAVGLIRRWRLQRDGQGEERCLILELLNHIGDCIRRYPETDWATIQSALQAVAAGISEL